MTDPGFSIYIHWPFCLTKCSYCDFNSHVVPAIDQPRWRAAYLRELGHAATKTAGRRVDTVFFGGGTPSLMDPETVAALLKGIKSRWAVATDLEVTLEANPTSAETTRFAGFRAAGVNRLSLGVQALDDDALRALGRKHSAAEATAAVELATQHFERVSLDLIYARPGQEVTAWRRELARAIMLGCGHLSAYQLTIEFGSGLYPRLERGELTLPDEDMAADLFEATNEVLATAGLPAYEISNHARPGQECRHNLMTWRGGDSIGIGPGAHGRLRHENGSRWATQTCRDPNDWLTRVEQFGHGEQPPEAINEKARLEELLMLGLRLAEGVSLPRIRTEFGRDLTQMLNETTLTRLIDGGFLELGNTALRATPAGRQRLNAVLVALIV